MNCIAKRGLIALLAVTVLLVLADRSYAAFGRKDYFFRPQAGVWFGPLTPLGSTNDLVDTALGGGLFLRYNLPLRSFKIGLDSSYQHLNSKGVNEIYLVPVYGSLVYLLPFNLPVRFQVKAGIGSSYVYVKPDKIGQWDPMLSTGFELSFPAGRIVNIGLRIDYLYIYEGYIDGAEDGAHVINAGISLYFNI